MWAQDVHHGNDGFEMDAHDRLTGIIATLANLPSTNVVLVGDIMMDRYIHGFADNSEHQSSGPCAQRNTSRGGVGAAAHVARGLVSLGLNPCLFGVVGDDGAGVSVLEYLSEEGVNTDTISIVEGRTTTVKTRLLATRQNLVRDEQLMLRWDIEADEPMPSEALDAMYDLACEQVDGAAAVILSDYGQGVVTDEGAARLIERAKAAGVPVIAIRADRLPSHPRRGMGRDAIPRPGIDAAKARRRQPCSSRTWSSRRAWLGSPPRA